MENVKPFEFSAVVAQAVSLIGYQATKGSNVPSDYEEWDGVELVHFATEQFGFKYIAK